MERIARYYGDLVNRAFILIVLTLSGCEEPRTSLVERGDLAERARFELSGAAHDALVLPFPAERRFEVDLPSAAFLRVSPALVTEQNVRRARVSFGVIVEAEDDSVEVFNEVFRFGDANRWHSRVVDLSAWSEERVVLVLVTRTPEDRNADILWADRVRTVWGELALVSSPGRMLAKAAGGLTLDAESWLLEQGGVDYNQGVSLATNLILAGFLALVIRGLYIGFAPVPSNRHAFGNLFPVFTLTTVLVIVVVESSLALSLGLIGALSVVRFRTAIKTPDEIAYLLFCIAVGVALGARQRPLAVAVVVLVSLFVVVRQRLWPRMPDRTLLLVVSGDADRFFEQRALEQIPSVVQEFRMRRLEQEGDRVELSAVVTVTGPRGVARLVADMRKKLPAFQFSFVEADEIP